MHSPQVLELTAADELVALENVDVLRQNGFELEVCEDRAPGQRVQLHARPISKSTVFDTKGASKPCSHACLLGGAQRRTLIPPADLEELLHLLQDRPAGQMVRCSKARAMFAMRACRMSIMIGTPLSRRQMTSVRRLLDGEALCSLCLLVRSTDSVVAAISQVVQHMGTMDQPWHCPHGRPTMRHLSDIAGAGWERRTALAQAVDWAAFARAEA